MRRWEPIFARRAEALDCVVYGWAVLVLLGGVKQPRNPEGLRGLKSDQVEFALQANLGGSLTQKAVPFAGRMTLIAVCPSFQRDQES